MTSCPETACPLCLRVQAREQLYDHIAAEHPQQRLATVKVIQGYHSGWVEAQGACRACWASFREAARILRLLKGARLQQPGQDWNPTKLLTQAESSEQTPPNESYSSRLPRTSDAGASAY